MQGHLDVVKLLMEHGALVDQSNDTGAALQAVCCNGHVHVVDFLLKSKADPNIGSGDFRRPIFPPIFQNDTRVLSRLLEDERLELNFLGGSHNSAPLHCAALFLLVENVKQILEKGASVDLADTEGDTALMAAVEAGDIETVKLLLEYGNNILIGSSAFGLVALDIAAQLGKAECVNLLVARATAILHEVKTAADEQIEEALDFIQAKRLGRYESMDSPTGEDLLRLRRLDTVSS